MAFYPSIFSKNIMSVTSKYRRFSLLFGLRVLMTYSIPSQLKVPLQIGTISARPPLRFHANAKSRTMSKTASIIIVDTRLTPHPRKKKTSRVYRPLTKRRRFMFIGQVGRLMRRTKCQTLYESVQTLVNCLEQWKSGLLVEYQSGLTRRIGQIIDYAM